MDLRVRRGGQPGSQTTTYSYNDGDRITTVTPPSPASSISYTWDDNGNLTNRGSDTFAWDYEDRKIVAEEAAGTSMSSLPVAVMEGYNC